MNNIIILPLRGIEYQQVGLVGHPLSLLYVLPSTVTAG